MTANLQLFKFLWQWHHIENITFCHNFLHVVIENFNCSILDVEVASRSTKVWKITKQVKLNIKYAKFVIAKQKHQNRYL